MTVLCSVSQVSLKRNPVLICKIAGDHICAVALCFEFLIHFWFQICLPHKRSECFSNICFLHWNYFLWDFLYKWDRFENPLEILLCSELKNCNQGNCHYTVRYKVVNTLQEAQRKCDYFSEITSCRIRKALWKQWHLKSMLNNIDSDPWGLPSTSCLILCVYVSISYSNLVK